jgi:uncharacterized membrane protein/uncharacterized membrane protein YeaQ/YmgE (transglycosylase-associated protein family)
MHVWQWLFTGMVAGLIARLALRRSPIGLGGDLALGALGGLAAGALLHLGGVTDAGGNFIHVAVALTGAIGVIAAMHGIARLAIHATRIADPARSLKAMMADADSVEREVVEKFLQREPVSRDVHREEAQVETLGQRVADRVAQFGGSWTFIGLFAAALFTWMLYNIEEARPFDPFPFILLNLLLSCLAAVQAPIILMSQNRQAQKDRHHVQADYAVNLKSEVEILALHAKIDELRERAWRELLAQQERQLAILERLERSQAVADVGVT